MRLVPVRALKSLEPAVEALCNVFPLWTPEWVFEQVGLRTVAPYRVESNGDTIAIVFLREERFGATKALNLWGLWARPEAPRGWLTAFFDCCRDHARATGCSEVMASTSRRGWARYVERVNGEAMGAFYRLRGV